MCQPSTSLLRLRLADLPRPADQATGQCRHGAPGGDTPVNRQAPGARWAPPPREARCSLTRTFSERPSGPDSPPYPQDLRINPRGPPPQAPAPTLGPSTSFVGLSSLFTSQWTPTLDFCPLQNSPLLLVPVSLSPTNLSQRQDPQIFQDVVPISPCTFPPYFQAPCS